MFGDDLDDEFLVRRSTDGLAFSILQLHDDVPSKMRRLSTKTERAECSRSVLNSSAPGTPVTKIVFYELRAIRSGGPENGQPTSSRELNAGCSRDGRSATLNDSPTSSMSSSTCPRSSSTLSSRYPKVGSSSPSTGSEGSPKSSR